MTSKIKTFNHNHNKTGKELSFKHSFLKSHNYSNLHQEIASEKKYQESCQDESFEIFCEYFQDQPINKIQSKESFTSFHDFRQNKNQIDPFNITPIFQRISSKIDETNSFKHPNNLQLCNNLFPKCIKKLQFESVKNQQYQYPTWNKQQLQINRFKRSKIKNNVNQHQTSLFENNHDKNNIQGNRQKKNGDRSLKSLAISVLRIVQYYNKTTYKDIAEKLVSDMLQQGVISSDKNVKQSIIQSKNISNAKRRVYDALNVLISVNALQKQGKFISSQRCEFTVFNKLKQQTKIRKNQLNLKIWKLSELYKKYISVKNFIDRNKNKDSNDSELRIQLPFVFVSYPKSNSIRIELNNNSLKVQMSKNFKVWGDVQMISRLNISKYHPIQNDENMLQIQEYVHNSLQKHQNIF